VRNENTIFALASGRGLSGIAVIRLSGESAIGVVERLARRRPPPRQATLVSLRHPESRELLDRALAILFPAPSSFTGEDVVELHVHGGSAVIDGVLEAIHATGLARAAEAGEFTYRAFRNGKLDLTAAEALGDLIAAETAEQRRLALRQAGGELGRLYDGWREKLLDALALVEASLDFMDEADVPANAIAHASPIAEALESELRRHLDDGRRGEIVRNGFKVAIAGPPNVGKSSLLNRLARRSAAIVSEEPGTTRDVIVVRMDLDGLPVLVSDTAGLRQATGKIEQEGIRRTIVEARAADLVVWLSSVEAPAQPLPHELHAIESKTLRVMNKADLRLDSSLPYGMLAVSALTGEGIEALTTRIAEEGRARIGLTQSPVLTRMRHRDLVTRAADALADFRSGDSSMPELRAEDLRRAAHALGRITGRVDVDDVLGRIFSAFCIGK
jgi:tRNA modification GTPase